MKNKITAVVLSFLLISLSQLSKAGDRACQALFVTGRAQILEKLRRSKFLLLGDYQGQRGYLRFVEELNAPLNMQYVFEIVSQYLSKKQRQELGWKRFHGPTKEYRELKEKIVDKAGQIRTEYLGMEGYALFADREYKREYSAGEYAGDMQKAYMNISAILDKKQRQELGWKQFHGSTKEYRELKEKIVDKAGQIRTEYLGMEGYALFADREYKREYSAGDMQKAYLNISVILDKKQRQELGWKRFHGSTTEYRELKEKIVDKAGQIRTEYLGMEGYALFADREYKREYSAGEYAGEYAGDMLKAYLNISAILDKKQRQELGWQQFQGSTKEYRELKEKIVDKAGQIRTEYLGMEGYALFADRHYDGFMLKTYKNISAFLDRKQRQELGWKRFQGPTKEYRELKEKIADKAGKIRTEYFGMEGYALFADRHYDGFMLKTYKNISAFLDRKQRQELDWKRFQGPTKEYRELKEKIADKAGKIRTEYFGMEGYVSGRAQILEKLRRSEFLLLRDYQGQRGYLRFVEELNTSISMKYVFEIVSQYLSKKQRQELGWKRFRGSTKEYRELKKKIVDKAGQIRTEYLGMEGYALFADREYKREYSAGEYAGDMQKAYLNISAILDKKQRQELGWQQFHGSTKEYRELKEKIVDKAGQIRTEYLGMEGYALFADREYKREYSAGEYAGDMQKAYLNISAILDKKQRQELGWQQFHGSTKEYRELKEKIVDKAGQIRTEYLGMEGYALFADREYKREYSAGDMLKAYMNISAILDKKQRQELGWKRFQGPTTNYKELKEKIVDKDGKIRTEYLGMESYALFADRHYDGNMQKAYKNISAILDRKQRQELGWQKFQGPTKEYRELKEKIADKAGQIRTEYLGMEGYALFADRHYDGNMLKAYMNISAILGGVKRTRELGLGWKQFPGTVSEFYALK